MHTAAFSTYEANVDHQRLWDWLILSVLQIAPTASTHHQAMTFLWAERINQNKQCLTVRVL